jgi:hypothetical protein
VSAVIVNLKPFISARDHDEVSRLVNAFRDHVITLPEETLITEDDIERWAEANCPRRPIRSAVEIGCIIACNDLEDNYEVLYAIFDDDNPYHFIGYQRSIVA